MKKIEAAEILALYIKVNRNRDTCLTKLEIEETVSELMHHGTGLHKVAANVRPAIRTIETEFNRINK